MTPDGARFVGNVSRGIPRQPESGPPCRKCVRRDPGYHTPLILREYKRMVEFVDSPTADSDSVTEGTRAPYKSWVPNTISASDYQDIRMALQDSNKPARATKVRTPRAKRAVKEPATVKPSAFSVSRAFETINAFSAFKTMHDVIIHIIEMLGDN